MDRRAFIGGWAGLLAAPLAAEALQAPKLPRIGYLMPGSLESPETRVILEALRQGLRENSYVEGLTLPQSLLQRADQVIE